MVESGRVCPPNARVNVHAVTFAASAETLVARRSSEHFSEDRFDHAPSPCHTSGQRDTAVNTHYHFSLLFIFFILFFRFPSTSLSFLLLFLFFLFIPLAIFATTKNGIARSVSGENNVGVRLITRRGLLPFCNNLERNAVLLRVKFAVHGKFAL